MVPSDYGLLEQNIDVLLQMGNMIGDRHYDELEAFPEKTASQVNKFTDNAKIYER